MWTYLQPTEIKFGLGVRKGLGDIASRFGGRPILVTDATLASLPMTAEVIALLVMNTPVFSDVPANPTIDAVDALAQTIRENHIDVAIALGGGSALDCAKAACSVAVEVGSARDYHSGGKKLSAGSIPLIAVPTTAGTGSEVTPISVLDDPEKGLKAPIVHPNFYPKVAIIDPELTLTMPRFLTACTGLDALSHAVEGYWSRNHQPLCDLMALKAVELVMTHLPIVLKDATTKKSREGMSLAALMGGLAFQLPKNAAAHACSFPLSSKYHLPHGAACAMTLDHFIRFNAEAMGPRGDALANAAGTSSMSEFADRVTALKQEGGLPIRLEMIGVNADDIDALVESSFHPLMNNNPREVTREALGSLYREML